MKTVVIACVLILFAPIAHGAITKDQLIEQIREKVAQLQREQELSQKAVADAKGELGKAQEQINKITTERDHWRQWGEGEHDKWMNAEIRVAKAQKEVWKMRCILGGLLTAIGIYLFLKFYLRLPI